MSKTAHQTCANFELCESEAVNQGLCMTCGSWFKAGGAGWDALHFFECDEECCVCGETVNKKVLFPTNCGHSFCIPCSREILFFDQSRYCLSPVQFGCPPCPNGCTNPVKGKQCGCFEYDEIQENWERNFPNKYREWSEEQDKSIMIADNLSCNGKAECPLCRKRYVRRNR